MLPSGNPGELETDAVLKTGPREAGMESNEVETYDGEKQREYT